MRIGNHFTAYRRRLPIITIGPFSRLDISHRISVLSSVLDIFIYDSECFLGLQINRNVIIDRREVPLRSRAAVTLDLKTTELK